MGVLFVASRFHEGDPRRGMAVQALGLIAGLRRRSEEVTVLDPFATPSDTTELQRALARRPSAIIVHGPLPPSWPGWSMLDLHARGATPVVAMATAPPPSCPSIRQLVLPPAIDPELYPASGERDVPWAFVGRLDPLRESLLGQIDAPGTVLDSGLPGEPRVPRHTIAALLGRCVIGLDLPGRRRGRVHGRTLQALAAGAIPIAPRSEELATCLAPGTEVLTYDDNAELPALVRDVLHDPGAFAGLVEAGRRRVMREHTFDARAEQLLRELSGSTESPFVVPAMPPAQPSVFVYMAVRNGGPHLPLAVDSILTQSHRELTLCVVNDGSTDDTARYLDATAALDPRVRVLHQSPHNEAQARNEALRHLPAEASYLCNHDADDVSAPDKLSRMVAFLERHRDVDLVGCQARYMSEDGQPRQVLELPTQPEVIDATFHQENSLVHSATLFRREVYDRVRGYREEHRTVDDYDFFARALQAGYRAANLPDVLHSIRLRDGSVSGRESGLQEARRRRVSARLARSLPWRLAARRGQPTGARLHLGCGERYLDGYVNVDLGADSHTVQTDRRLDLEEDLTYLTMPPGSCSEVRLHHVFEHFPRTEALRLLLEWHRWLADGGRLVLETPDLEGSLHALRPGQPPGLRSKVLRHLFGSQEAAWAFHVDAYDEERFRHMLPRLGFDVEHVERAEWQDLANITVTCRKRAVPEDARRAAAVELLAEALVDHSSSELRLHEVWQNQLGCATAAEAR